MLNHKKHMLPKLTTSAKPRPRESPRSSRGAATIATIATIATTTWNSKGKDYFIILQICYYVPKERRCDKIWCQKTLPNLYRDNLIHHLQNFQESKRQTSVETAWNRWSSDQGWWTTGKILSCESATKKCEEKKLKKQILQNQKAS